MADKPAVQPQKDPVLESLVLGDRFTSELAADPDERNQTRQVHKAAYSRVPPAKVGAPKLVAWTADLASELKLDAVDTEAQHVAEIFSGQQLLAGSDPYAMAYSGHQFGNWAGQLGDGRAIAVGEVDAISGQPQTLQLKGAGPTPFSRRADGLAVLRSSIREFLASEAMHHLGVPTTRALSLVTTGDEVMRDMLYDGHPALEPGAIVCRTAPSFIRFGNFEMFASRSEDVELQQLADFTIRHFFDHLEGSHQPDQDVYQAWFDEVCQTTAELMVNWLRVGFVHGVMNTDNMSIHGLTIDYGPYGWLDDFDPGWTPNTTDSARRRYRFGHQGAVAQWNLLQLGRAILPLVGQPEPLERSVNAYAATFVESHKRMMLNKLGILNDNDQPLDGSEDGDGASDATTVGQDAQLVNEVLQLLTLAEMDMTIFFRRLAAVDAETADPLQVIADAYYDVGGLTPETRKKTGDWFRRYQERIGGQPDEDRISLMNATNPAYVLRNYLAQEAIELATNGDYSRVDELARVLRDPYLVQADAHHFGERRPDWARDRVGCSQLSCSS